MELREAIIENRNGVQKVLFHKFVPYPDGDTWAIVETEEGNILEVRIENLQFVKEKKPLNLPISKVVFFKLKNKKYMTKNNIEITDEMLSKYPHHLSELSCYIIIG